MVTMLAQIATVFSLIKSPIHFSELLLPYILLSSFISTIHVQIRFVVVGLCHINLPPKLLGSSCESEKPLLGYHFHINAARVLVAEHLMWRQQLFLELLYHHILVCLLAVFFFSLECFGRLSLTVNHFSSTSALASQGQGCPRHASWVAMITAVFFICNYEPWHGPQA